MYHKDPYWQIEPSDDDVSDFEDNSPACPVCQSDDSNVKWEFYDDDTETPSGRLLECESCGTLFNYWYSP